MSEKARDEAPIQRQKDQKEPDCEKPVSAAESTALYRLSVLEQGQVMGISHVCRLHGLSRPKYYEWKKRYLADGIEGLHDEEKPKQSHPFKTSEDDQATIESYALQYPEKSAAALQLLLEEEQDLSLSPVTIQKILNSKNLGKKSQRLTAYQKWQATYGQPTSGNETKNVYPSRWDDSPQAKAFFRTNPALKEYAEYEYRPGRQLFQFGFTRRSLQRGGSVYVQVIVDPSGAMAWVEVLAAKKSEQAESFFRRTYFDYLAKGVKIRSVVTDNGSEFCFDHKPNWRYLQEREAGAVHRFEHFVSNKNIDHYKILNHRYKHLDREPRDQYTIYEEIAGGDIPVQRANGIVERFYNTLRHDFFDTALKENPQMELQELQTQLATWLTGYNETFSHLHEGFPNFGQPPKLRLEQYLENAQRPINR